jgi:CRP/FNR family transcriptional regulator, cyclic AMP receptor protein
VLEVVSSGKRIIVQTLGRGEAMGWSALTGTAKTHFQARALSHTQTIAFDGIKLSVLFEYDKSLGYEIIKRLLALVTERLDHSRMQLIDIYGPQSGVGEP